MSVPNTSNSPHCSIFSLSNSHVKQGLTITGLTFLLIAGIALIVLGSLGTISLLPGIISGAILITAVLLVIVLLTVCKLIDSTSPIEPVVPVDEPVVPIDEPVVPIDEPVVPIDFQALVNEYRLIFDLPGNMPYRIVDAGTLREGIRMSGVTSYIYDHEVYAFLHLDPPVCIDIQHDGSEILFIIGKG